MEIVKNNALGIDLLDQTRRKVPCGITAVGTLDHVVLTGIHVLHRIFGTALGTCICYVLKTCGELSALICSRILADPVILVIIDSVKDLLLKFLDG